MKKVLVFVGGYIPGSKYGGPISSIFNLVEALKSDICFKIVTRDRDLGDKETYASIVPERWNMDNDQDIFYSDSLHKSVIKIQRIILEQKPDLVYLNSIFSLGFGVLPILAIYLMRKRDKPRVLVAPRSELLLDVIKPKYFRKTVYLNIIRILGFYRWVEWQATSNAEIASIKKVFPKANIHFLPNIPSYPKLLNSHDLKRNIKTLKIIFLSRISEKKNLMFLVKLLCRIEFKITLDIYGPLEDPNYWEECKKTIVGLPANILCNYVGALSKDQVAQTF